LGHVTNEFSWGELDIDTNTGRIFFQQKWLYSWRLWTGVSRGWTVVEKQAFHNAVDRSIWRRWSNRIRFSVSGTSDFAKRFQSKTLPINLDARWVLSGPKHWDIIAYKMPPGSDRRTHVSNVLFSSRVVELDTADIPLSTAGNAAGASGTFHTPPHEFGHMIGVGDEYSAGHANLSDTNSIMNIGTQWRARHVSLILDELNRMIPSTSFRI
jgi:hypothetical protein